MATPTPPQPPEVTTEPQRKALDEMSQNLVEKLNEMVREQNERVERFAAIQHSRSATPAQMAAPDPTSFAPVTPPSLPSFDPAFTLPELPSTPAPDDAARRLPCATFTPVQSSRQKDRKQRREQRHAPAPEPPELPEFGRPDPIANTQAGSGRESSAYAPEPKQPKPVPKKKEEGQVGCGTIFTIVVIVIIILRSCG